MTTKTQQDRKPRFKRAKIRPFQVQERDLDIIKVVYKHRFLSSEHITALIDGSGQGILRRLQLLYHAGYLDRPKEQVSHWVYSRRIVYGLGNKGADLLAGILDLPDQRPGVGHEQAKVLRSIPIRQFHGLCQVAGDHNATPVSQRHCRDIGPALDQGSVFAEAVAAPDIAAFIRLDREVGGFGRRIFEKIGTLPLLLGQPLNAHGSPPLCAAGKR